MDNLERDLYGNEGQSGNGVGRSEQRTPKPEPKINKAQEQGNKEIYNKVYQMLTEQGIASHEADQHIKFMMNPGEITPAEVVEMYKALSASRGKPINNATKPNTTTQGVSREPAVERTHGKNGMPPMSVVGVSGQSTDPRLQADEARRVKNRNAYDPNNAS